MLLEFATTKPHSENIKPICRELEIKRDQYKWLTKEKRRDSQKIAQKIDGDIYSTHEKAMKVIWQALEDAELLLEDIDLDQEFQKRAHFMRDENGRITHCTEFGAAIYHFQRWSRIDQLKERYSEIRVIELMTGYINGAHNFYPWFSAEVIDLAIKFWGDFISEDHREDPYWV